MKRGLPFELFLGLRYLGARGQRASLSLFVWIGVGGVFLGVAALIVVLAVMTGFQDGIRDRIISANPHLLVFQAGGKALTDPAAVGHVDRSQLSQGTELLFGEDGLRTMASDPETDVVVSAIVGAAGLTGTWAAIDAGKTVALANKETLVVAGPLVTELAARRRAKLLPVDSEHSAIFQAIGGCPEREVARVVLTAELSGGANDFQEYYCPTVLWDWADGTESESTLDCEPYQAGKSEIKRRYTVQHIFRAGAHKVWVRLKRNDKLLASANVTIQIQPGRGIETFFDFRSEGIEHSALGPPRASRRHHARFDFPNNLFPGFGILADIGIVHRVEHQPGGLRPLVMTSNAVLSRDCVVEGSDYIRARSRLGPGNRSLSITGNY